MIPLKDDNPRKGIPFVTIGLIVLNVIVQIYQWHLGRGADAFVYRLGVIPWELTHFQELPNLKFGYQSEIPNLLTIFTSLFIHGGLLHLAGNMLYLWIFGDNVEALMGPLRFLVFYIACGTAAAFSQIILSPDSTVPMVGASGAISGVLGAYLVRFPGAKISVFFIFFFIIRIIKIPALIVLGFWFIMQIASGFGSLGSGQAGGVAWFAHVGGFLAGMGLISFFEKRGRSSYGW
jgi:membrane associated rhomboid family serine protease